MTEGTLVKVVGGLVLVTAGFSGWLKMELDEPRGNDVLVVGETLEDFALSDIDGKPIELHAFARDKKVVLLSFWASWCRPCRLEMPFLIAAHEKYGDDGLGILAVNIDSDPDEMHAYLAEHPLPFPVLVDRRGALLKSYGFNALPSAVALDENAEITHVLEGAQTQTLRFTLGAWMEDGGPGSFQVDFGFGPDPDADTDADREADD